jgi:hypothetical protein
LKLSETPPAIQSVRKGYIDARWTQLSDVSNAYGEESVKYLLLVNTAAMGAALAFVGAMPHLRPLLWPKVVLMLFAFGVAILGVFHAFRYHRIEWMFNRWRKDVQSYTDDQLTWNDLIDRDEKRRKRFGIVQATFPYFSLLSFYVGLTVGAFNFADIAPKSPGGSHDQAQSTATTATPAGAAARTEQGTAPDTGSIARPARKDSRP